MPKKAGKKVVKKTVTAPCHGNAEAMIGKQNALKNEEPMDDRVSFRCVRREKEEWRSVAEELDYENLSDFVSALMRKASENIKSAKRFLNE